MISKKILLLSLVVAVVFLLGCTQSQPTQREYVCSNGQVVLDSSNCPAEKEEKYSPFIVRVYASDTEQWPGECVGTRCDLPSSDVTSLTLDRLYGAAIEGYGPVYLFVQIDPEERDFLEYQNDDKICTITEYYGSIMNDKVIVNTVDVAGSHQFSSGFGYEENNKPQRVRYEVECKGIESGYTASAIFHINLNYR